MTIKSKKMLEGAKGQACVNCGCRDETVVAAHYQGIRSYEFGKASARYTLKKNIKLLEMDKESFKEHIDKHKELLEEINTHFIHF